MPTLRPIKAVVFDLYETLVTESGLDVPRAGALGPAFGVDRVTYRRQWKPLRPLVIRGEMTLAEALRKAGKQLGVEISAEQIRRAVDERMRARTTVLHQKHPDLMTLTRDLARLNIALATISNCMAEDVAGWARCPLAPYVACTLFSCMTGLAKPDPRIYLAATRQLAVDPEEALYVGDGGDDELCGAREAGLQVAQAGWFVARDRYAGVPFLATPHEVMRVVLAAQGAAS